MPILLLLARGGLHSVGLGWARRLDHAAKTCEEDPNRVLIIQDAQVSRVRATSGSVRQHCLHANVDCTHAAWWAACGGADGLREFARRYRKKLSDELRRFIAVDNVAVMVGELMKYRVVKNLARPAIKKESYPDAHIRESAEDELGRHGTSFCVRVDGVLLPLCCCGVYTSF